MLTRLFCSCCAWFVSDTCCFNFFKLLFIVKILIALFNTDDKEKEQINNVGHEQINKEGFEANNILLSILSTEQKSPDLQ